MILEMCSQGDSFTWNEEELKLTVSYMALAQSAFIFFFSACQFKCSQFKDIAFYSLTWVHLSTL